MAPFIPVGTQGVRIICLLYFSLCAQSMHTNVPYFPEDEVLVIWAKPGQMARDVVRRSNLRVTYKYPSHKGNGILEAESANEQNCFRGLDVDPTVKGFYAQSATIYYIENGILRSHYPDIFVDYQGNRRSFIEVKAADDPHLSLAYQRAEILRSPLMNQGYGYEVRTSSQILTEPYFSNARTILRLAHKPISLTDAEKMRCLIAAVQPVTWTDVIAGRLGPQGPFIVARMILKGILAINQEIPLGRQSVISLLQVLH